MKKKIKTDCYDTCQWTADQCELTCCREWKIAVDDETLLRWKEMKAPIGEGKRLDQFVCDIEGGKIIQLDENKMCPF